MSTSNFSAKFDSYTIEFVLLCDQVRREDNGKLFAIGIYSGTIVLSEFPATLVLSLVTMIRAHKIGEARIELRILLDGAPVAGWDAMFGSPEATGSELISLPPIPVAVPHAGQLEFQFRQRETDAWQTVLAKRVTRGPVAQAAS
jgi:hypothetical protein